ncbi:MAG: chorismate synthase [Desulfohalobiaceae bacterium]
MTSNNTFGRLFQLTTYGESHGPAIGGVVDGCPSGVHVSESVIQAELDQRKPSGNEASTPRAETDRVQILSGVFEELTTGTPIGFSIPNQDSRTQDYSELKKAYRPGHADYTYAAKYGLRDHRGGGRASARETACRVVGGAVAKQFLAEKGIFAIAYTRKLGGIEAEVISPDRAAELPYFAPDPSVVQLWEKKLSATRKAGDSLGGIVEIQVRGVPAGLGEPVFDKLDARLSQALVSVGAVKGVEIGAGLEAAELTGSRNNDPILKKGFSQNNSGGILGGISSGQTVVLRAAVKPIPSINKPQRTVNNKGQEVTLQVGGRHDISAIPRIVPVLKAMTLLTIADMWLLHQSRA